MNMDRVTRGLVVGLMLALLVACTPGGSGATTPPAPSNVAPANGPSVAPAPSPSVAGKAGY